MTRASPASRIYARTMPVFSWHACACFISKYAAFFARARERPSGSHAASGTALPGTGPQASEHLARDWRRVLQPEASLRCLWIRACSLADSIPGSVQKLSFLNLAELLTYEPCTCSSVKAKSQWDRDRQIVCINPTERFSFGAAACARRILC